MLRACSRISPAGMAGGEGTAGREQGLDTRPCLGCASSRSARARRASDSRRPSRGIDGIGAAGSGSGRLECGSEWS